MGLKVHILFLLLGPFGYSFRLRVQVKVLDSVRSRTLCNIGALIIAYIILGVPYYKCSIMGPNPPILIIKAPILHPLFMKRSGVWARKGCRGPRRLRDLGSKLVLLLYPWAPK